MFKRFLLLMIGSALAGLIGLPLGVGLLAQWHYDQALDRLTALGLHIQDRQYALGYARSTAQVTGVISGLAHSPEFTFHTEVDHWPGQDQDQPWRLARSLTTLTLNGQPLQTPNKPILQTVIDTDFERLTVLDVANFKARMFGNAQLTLARLYAISHSVPDADAQYRYTLQGMRLSLDDAELNATDLSGTVRLKRSPLGLMLIDDALNLAQLSFVDTLTGFRIAVHDLAWVSESDARDGTLSGSAHITLDVLDIKGYRSGPAQWHISAQGFSEKGVYTTQNGIRRIHNSRYSDERKSQQRRQFLKYHAWQAVAGQPRLTIHPFQIDTPDGRVQAHLDAGFNGIRSKDFRDRAFLQKLHLDSALQIPTPILTRAFQRGFEFQWMVQQGAPGLIASPAIQHQAAQAARLKLRELLQHGYLRQDGQQLHTQITLKDGQLNLNGFTVKY